MSPLDPGLFELISLHMLIMGLSGCHSCYSLCLSSFPLMSVLQQPVRHVCHNPSVVQGQALTWHELYHIRFPSILACRADSAQSACRLGMKSASCMFDVVIVVQSLIAHSVAFSRTFSCTQALLSHGCFSYLATIWRSAAAAATKPSGDYRASCHGNE